MITPNEIEAWRSAHGLTKKELATQIGISYPFMVDILNGKRELSESTAAKFELLRSEAAKVCRYDDVRAYAVRLTPAEFRQLCAVAGVQDMTAEGVEKVVRDLLQRTWDALATEVPQVVEEERTLEAAEDPVMPAPTALPVPFIPAARGGRDTPQC